MACHEKLCPSRNKWGPESLHKEFKMGNVEKARQLISEAAADSCRGHVNNGTNQGDKPCISSAEVKTHNKNNQVLGLPWDVKGPSVSASMRHSYMAARRILMRFLAPLLRYVTWSSCLYQVIL